VAAALAAGLSGGAALVYEVVWLRPITLLVGHTVGAVTAVLCAFLGGLGLGAALAARHVRRRKTPVPASAYAGLEGLIAVCGVALPLLAPKILPTSGAARFVASVLLLLPPAVLMGATLPVLAALLPARGARPGRTGGALYAANSAGAFLGALGTGFVLLPALGVRGSSAAAAALNLAAAFVVWLAVRGAPEAPAVPASEPVRAPKKKAREVVRDRAAAEPRLPASAVYAALGLGGLAALASEVAWTRALVLLIGPTAYAFAFILGAVIFGLAVGSAVTAAIADPLARPARALAFTQFATAAAMLAVAHAIGRMPIPAARAVLHHADDMDRLMGWQLAAVFGLLVLPAALSGASFPLAVRLLAPAGGTDPAVALGRAYAWNTVGCVLGSGVGGLFALPLLGLEWTLRSAALASALGGLAVLAPSPPARIVGAAIVAGLGAVAWLLPRWDRELMAGGPYKYAAYVREDRLEDELRAGELVFYREGRSATVSVKRLGGTLSLAVDGKVDATTGADMPTQKLLAHLPLLLHPAPRRACIVGLGSGATAAAALTHGIESLDVVEISPEVVAAARLMRDAVGSTDDPRLRLVVDDGRHHLLLAAPAYDVIISEPSNPWMAGVSALFTREFFALGASRLRDGGLFCQWIHLYNLSPDDLHTVVGGFTDVFPQAALFLASEGDALLVGSAAPLPAPDERTLASRATPRVRNDLAAIHVQDPAVLATLLAARTPALVAWAAGAPRHTDDRPRLERSAPRTLHANTTADNRRQLLAVGWGSAADAFSALAREPSPHLLLQRARMLELAKSHDWAFETYARVAAERAADGEVLEGLVRSALRAGRAAEARSRLQALAGAHPASARAALGLLDFNEGQPASALDHLRAALAADPRKARPLVLAAEIQQAAGHLEAARELARAAVLAQPGDDGAEAALAAIELQSGDAPAARARAEAVLVRSPRSAAALEVAAVARAQAGDRAGARRAFEALLAVSPDDAEALTNFAILELEEGAPARAARLFAQAVALDPRAARAYEGLRLAAERAGDRSLRARAEAGLERLRRDPGQPK
jgi:spermidine synthase